MAKTNAKMPRFRRNVNEPLVTLRYLQNIFKSLPKWQNFTKSGRKERDS